MPKKLIRRSNRLFSGTFFLKKLGLDSILESWDLKIRIPRRKLRIWSYSQVETRQYRSKYLKICLLICFFDKLWVLKRRFLAFPGGPGGFRELREAGRNHFHLSWYLSVPGVTSYAKKTNKEKQQIILGYVFPKKTWSRLNFGVLGPENSDSSSKTTYMVLFPG